MALKREPRAECGDCGVPIGQLHDPGCDVERCPNCGFQAIGCDCSDGEVAGVPRLPWTGIFPGVAECQAFGWYARLVPGCGWETCGPAADGATENISRLYAEARWDKKVGAFVRVEPQGVKR